MEQSKKNWLLLWIKISHVFNEKDRKVYAITILSLGDSASLFITNIVSKNYIWTS